MSLRVDAPPIIDSCTAERERFRPVDWLPEAQWVAQWAAGLPVQPWDPSTLTDPDDVGRQAGDIIRRGMSYRWDDLTAADLVRATDAVVVISRIPATKNPVPVSNPAPIRLKTTRHGCSNPRGIVTTDPATGVTSTLVVPCELDTCPECRWFRTESWTERTLAGFAGQTVYQHEVAGDDHAWKAWVRRARYHGVEWVQVPAAGGARLVLATDALDPSAAPLRDAAAEVRAALAARPMEKEPRRISASRGFVPQVADKPARDDAPDPAVVEVVGFWNPREGIRQAAAAAAEAGITVRRFNPTAKVVAGFALEGIDWRRDQHRPEVVRFLRAIAFQPKDEADKGPDLVGDWQDDPYLHRRKRDDGPPLDAYPEADPTYREGVAA